MWTCVRWEIRRQIRQARFWGSLAALVVLGGLFAYGYGQMHGAAAVVAYIGDGMANGFFVPILALALSCSVLLPFFVVVFSGDSIAGERQMGTWPLMLAHGINPWRLYVAKWLVGAAYVALATVLLASASLVGGWLLFGLHGGPLPSGVNVSQTDFWRLLAVMTGYTVAGQMVVSGLALMVSAFSRHTVSALMIAMGSLIVLAMMGDVPVFGQVRRLFFTTYFSRIGAALGFPPAWLSLEHGVAIYALYAGLFWAAILWCQPFRE